MFYSYKKEYAIALCKPESQGKWTFHQIKLTQLVWNLHKIMITVPRKRPTLQHYKPTFYSIVHQQIITLHLKIIHSDVIDDELVSLLINGASLYAV